ncbi:MAG: hypothetical protein KDM81_21135, partial [Verrucomicrobiae bacterium]|nr:hypothetical protein [Verrucomicrobiae bacterium]
MADLPKSSQGGVGLGGWLTPLESLSWSEERLNSTPGENRHLSGVTRGAGCVCLGGEGTVLALPGLLSEHPELQT